MLQNRIAVSFHLETHLKITSDSLHFSQRVHVSMADPGMLHRVYRSQRCAAGLSKCGAASSPATHLEDQIPVIAEVSRNLVSSIELPSRPLVVESSF